MIEVTSHDKFLIKLFATAIFGVLISAFGCAPALAAENPADARSRWYVVTEAGAGTVATRDSRDETLFSRATLAGRLGPGRLFVRGDLARTQDGGDLADPAALHESFRAVELATGYRAYVAGDLSLGAVGGFTVSAEGNVGKPSDPRLYSVLSLACLDLDETARSYACAGAGHRGPVGGPALTVAVSIPTAKGANVVLDFDYPLRKGRGPVPWVARFGVLARVWGRGF